MKHSIIESLTSSREVSSADATRLAEILEQYLEQLEKGQAPDHEQILAANPDLADVLVHDLHKLELLHRAVLGLGSSSGENSVDSLAFRSDFESATLGDFRLIHEIGRGGTRQPGPQLSRLRPRSGSARKRTPEHRALRGLPDFRWVHHPRGRKR